MTSTGIPKGWSLPRLDQIARVTSGKRLPKGRSVTALATPHPYIRVTDMRMGKVDLSNIHYVPEDVAPTISRYTVDAGDLYISCAGTLGIVGRVPDILHGANLTENANRISAIQVNPDYLLHVLMSEAIQGRIQNIQTVGAQPKLALGRIRSFEIPCPDDPKEQEAIAEALSDADALIEGLERLIAKKRLIKQGAMQDLLTAKRRLPGFSGEWIETPLGEVGPFVGGGTPSMARADFWKDGTIPWVSSSDIRIGELHSADRMITVDAVKGSSTRVVDPGSILFVTRSGILRRFQPVMINTVPVAINQDIKALLPRSSEYSAAYVFHAAVGAGDQILRDCMKTGTTVESIDLTALRRFCVSCPKERDEQDAIATVLTDIDAEIQALNTRLEKARQVKEGTMQNLLTGRIRLV